MDYNTIKKNLAISDPMRIIFNWLAFSLAIFASSYLLPGVTLSGFSTALLTAAILGMANIFIKPLLDLLALPFNILKLGAFRFLVGFAINVIFVLIVSAIVPGFKIKNIGWAILFALVLAVVRFLIDRYLKFVL